VDGVNGDIEAFFTVRSLVLVASSMLVVTGPVMTWTHCMTDLRVCGVDR